MNVLFVCIDTLRRDCLTAYRDRPVGFEYAVETPHFDRFADRAAVFDNYYAGSLPTVPARREYLTGTQGFLWRGWGPLEPFDPVLPVQAREAGTITQLITDNYHLFEDYHGPETVVNGYYGEYHGFEFVRGHEVDAWRTTPRDPDPAFLDQIDAADPHSTGKGLSNRTQYARNVASFEDETDFFAPRVFSTAAEWIADNREWEQWFLTVDSFDVHEPFHAPERYLSKYTDLDPDDPDRPKWHQYGWLEDDYWTEEKLAFVRAQYASKVTMVDEYFGAVLDRLDEFGLWEDTVVVVTSDHGHCLGDHGFVGKNDPPVYDELGRLPLLIWHPGSPRMGDRIPALTSAVDIYATIQDGLGVDGAERRHSRSLEPVLMGETGTHREWALYGYHGRSVNVTDGRYTYLHPTRPDGPLYRYSSKMPGENAEAGPFLPHTEYPVWRVADEPTVQNEEPLLFDTEADPTQETNLAGQEPAIEGRMRALLREAMDDLGAPDEQYVRLGLEE